MNSILITGIGGDIAQGVATIIRSTWPECYLIGVDMETQHAGNLFVDEFHKLPSASTEKYGAALKGLVKSRAIEVVIPMSEPELAVVNKVFDKNDGVHCLSVGESIINIGLDKQLTNLTLKNMGIEVPWSLSSSDGDPINFPCIMKSRKGSGSRTVFIVDDSDEAACLKKKHPDSIYQELLKPANREVTCAVYRTLDGRVSTLQMLRKLSDSVTGWAKIIEDSSIADMCQVIANGLDLRGSINVQLRLTDKGPRVFEINPRFSSTVLMRHKIGFSDLVWSLEELQGKRIHFPVISSGQVMVRVQDAVVLDA